MLENPTSADSLLVITDGLDEGSKNSPDEVLSQLAGPLIRVFTVLVDLFRVKGHVQTRVSSLGLSRSRVGRCLARSTLETLRSVTRQKVLKLGKSWRGQLGQFYRGILENNVLTIQVSAIQKPQAPR